MRTYYPLYLLYLPCIKLTCICMLHAVAHPLDPLTPEEIKAAAASIKAAAAEKDLSPLRFNVITLAVRSPPTVSL